MVIRSVPRRAAAVLGTLLAGLLLVLTGCATGGAAGGSSSGPPRSTATAAADAPGPSGASDRPRGMPVVPAGALPAQARDTLRLIDAGGPFPYPQDGTVFGNRERLLPRQPRGYYHEYTVPTPGSPDRGARRLVTGQGHETYYTDDHYRTFKAVLR
ncbi:MULTISPECIES: ribonuclease domain-containing protein [unclassified Streptomyces]|uniref:ribonuclease domain-containing protein n=1 Tax=unclassified Streptomyces TaxID=2593676 RepID=UPI000880946E|nr:MULTISPECIES: ribonuclease domain-containing protein [unclassified Streptomyces]PBC81265.1 ribonuclease T1 [Streptomyces sp. 2321.6]SDR55803.1 ribonuclease T1 [Streptomyces sp. KS_16]SEC08064.1 ribonuclease T1 [Streptomyces sp. 2133.1]SNC64540.1 ribonuclease T1 [Streptomyces sp. 2114.4]